MYKYPTMYKTKSSPSNINMKSPIATITTPGFISLPMMALNVRLQFSTLAPN